MMFGMEDKPRVDETRNRVFGASSRPNPRSTLTTAEYGAEPNLFSDSIAHSITAPQPSWVRGNRGAGTRQAVVASRCPRGACRVRAPALSLDSSRVTAAWPAAKRCSAELGCSLGPGAAGRLLRCHAKLWCDQVAYDYDLYQVRAETAWRRHLRG